MESFEIFSQKKSIEKIQEYLNNEAIILDVRTEAEWDEGHIENSTHIVLNTIPHRLEEIKALEKPIIAVCKSGGRSQSAADFLNQNGLNVINGGPWQNVNRIINK